MTTHKKHPIHIGPALRKSRRPQAKKKYCKYQMLPPATAIAVFFVITPIGCDKSVLIEISFFMASRRKQYPKFTSAWADGMSIRMPTLLPPPDCPIIVRFPTSPPKFPMLSRKELSSSLRRLMETPPSRSSSNDFSFKAILHRSIPRTFFNGQAPCRRQRGQELQSG
jgi:hypothetical protein